MLTIIDDFSRKFMSFFFKHESDVLQYLRSGRL